jgi:hypothetical protein
MTRDAVRRPNEMATRLSEAETARLQRLDALFAEIEAE